MNHRHNNTRIRPLPVNFKKMSSKSNTAKKRLAKKEKPVEEKSKKEDMWRELTIPEKRRLGTWR